MDKHWLIKGATVVSDEFEKICDVKVFDGRIKEIGENLADDGAVAIDGTNKVLLPGLIDDQVHFREPGAIHKACIKTESQAAVKGGVTSYLEMPNTNPATINQKELENKFAIASNDSLANYGFYLGTTGDNAQEISQAKKMGACGVKVFLGASTGNLLVDEQEKLEKVFASVPEGMVLCAHCEDAPRIAQRQERYLNEGGGDVPMSMHPVIRDEVACEKSTKRAMELAKRHNTRLHVLHITTARELKLFSNEAIEDKKITSEACVHHLWFCDDDYQRLGAKIKCNPAIKSVNDRDAIRKALTDGTIDVIATDHAPHLLEEKQGKYPQMAAGLPLIGHSLLILLDLVQQKVLTLSQVAKLAAKNPAKLFAIQERGAIKVGNYADLVLVDMQGGTKVTDQSAGYLCNWSPFAGHEFAAKILSVWVSGHLAFDNDELDTKTQGQKLDFNH